MAAIHIITLAGPVGLLLLAGGCAAHRALAELWAGRPAASPSAERS